MPANLDLVAARNVPWAPTIDLAYSGGALPLDGASVTLQVRLYPGAAGAPLLNLSGIEFDDVAAPSDRDASRRILRLFPTAAKVALASFPTGLNNPEPGEADRFSYDIVITYADAAADRPAAGYFYLEPGVTEDD